MAKIVKAPDKYTKTGFDKTIFLAGSIEMGKAEDWQTKISKELKDYNVLILNPRRDSWDDSWKQELENKQFKEQVNWELTGLEKSDIIAVYIDPETKSPITLLEIGLYSIHNPNKLIICCPKGFYRRGNIEVVCWKYNIPLLESFDDLKEEIIKKLGKKDFSVLKELK